MSDISKLLQEAKPLYFKRKKCRRQFKIATTVAGCLMIGVLVTGLSNRSSVSLSNLDTFYTYLYDDTAYNELLGTDELIHLNNDCLLWEEYELA